MERQVLLSLHIPESTRRRLRILSAERGEPIRALVSRQIDQLLDNADAPPACGSDHAPRSN